MKPAGIANIPIAINEKKISNNLFISNLNEPNEKSITGVNIFRKIIHHQDSKARNCKNDLKFLILCADRDPNRKMRP